jgi:ubiquinone/menaquinone biosynthesis C-methylase UbiE
MASAGALIHAALPYDLLLTVLTLGRERLFRERLVAPARLQQGESVVDIGCGTGSLAIAAARLVGPEGRVTGIDPSEAMVARARYKARRAKVAASFEVAFAQSLPFPDAQFDVVLSTVMLHHLPRATREPALREAHRVLRPGGRLLAVDFGADASAKKGLIGHIHRHGGLSAQDLAELVSGAGFAVTESGPTGTWDLQFVLATRG